MDLKPISEDERACFVRLGIPPRFQNKGFSNYEVNDDTKKAHKICEAYAHDFKNKFEAGAGLILAGAPGTGKTHLAFSILRYVATKQNKEAVEVAPEFNQLHLLSSQPSNYSVQYVTVFDLLKRVKATWDKAATESEKDALAVYSKPDLLILDEVGMQHGTDTEKVILFEVIDRRYQDIKPTIIVGNLTIAELTEYLGERVIDRMREGGTTAVIFSWDSYRKRDQ